MWEHFTTDGNLFGKNKFNKNAWCNACVAHHANVIRESEVVDAALTGIGTSRTLKQIEDDARNMVGPHCGKPKQNMVPHLIKCQYVAPVVKVLAEEWKNASDLPALGHGHPWPPGHIGISRSWSCGAELPSSIASSSSATPSPIGSPLLLALPSASSLKRARSNSDIMGRSEPIWAPSTQREFGEDFCKLLVAIRAAWNTAHNPEMIHFVQKWIPGAIVPDRRTLSGPILNREAGKVEDQLKIKLRGKLGTIQIDGWKNRAKKSIVASLFNGDFEPYLMCTHEVSSEAKTGEALLDLVKKDIKYCEDTYGVIITSLCSDDGGDARKMRRLLGVLMPWLIIILCWAHQVNLIVGDFLSAGATFLVCAPQALEVITWMNSHSRPLGFLHREQQSMGLAQLVLIRPVITRWTAHYLSLRRLLEVKVPLQSAWLKYGDLMLESAGTKGDAPAKAEAVQQIVQSTAFWDQVRITCAYLQPLAIAANITQASHTRLDHVLATLGNLYHIYSNPSLDPIARDLIQKSLEKRWAAADQAPFLAAVVLNPYLRGRCFSRADVNLTPIGLCNMLRVLHFRVFRTATGPDFQPAFMDYIHERAEFTSEFMGLESWEHNAKEKEREVNVAEVWASCDNSQVEGRNRLVKLALHIFSVVANSAGCERAFSHMGLVHTGIRSKLHSEKVRKATVVGMFINQGHKAAGRTRARESRAFSMPKETSGSSDVEDTFDIVEPDALDFGQLLEQLVARAAHEDADELAEALSTNPLPSPPVPQPSTPAPLTITIPPLSRTSSRPGPTTSIPSHSPPRKISIPLAKLFVYPTDSSGPLPNGPENFWKAGIENLDKEMRAYEILLRSEGEDAANSSSES